MPIQLYNTLTRRKEEFVPRDKSEVTYYCCGPTVYNYIHIGNARTFVMADVIRRYLEHAGYKVKFVLNITDIDDRIIHTANEQGLDFHAVAQMYTEAFFEDMAGIGLKLPDAFPRVTEHLNEIIAITQKLIANGLAYESDGSVYYHVDGFDGYGKLSGKNPDDLIAGSRVEVDETKRNPLDFVLWKAAKPGEPSWDSPWGKGRPGWHIECSAMSTTLLGETIDLHAGGADLIFPHHENEIAQSEGASGKPFARYWIHFGFLNVDNEKMSKSLGNFWLLRDALKKFRPEAIRLLFLQTHYASPLNFTEDNLHAAENAHKRLEAILNRSQQALELREQLGGSVGRDEVHEFVEAFSKQLDRFEQDVEAAMSDDFNTAAAMGKIFEVFNGLARITSTKTLNNFTAYVIKRARDLILQWNEFLGFLNLSTPQSPVSSKRVDDLVQLLIDLRAQARAKKDWATSDLIRDRLNAMGIALEDSPSGTLWRIQS